MTRLAALTAVLLFVWYLFADRITPYTSYARTRAIVIDVVPEVLGHVAAVSVTNGTGVTVGDPTRLTQSGFLTNYARLRPVDWADGIQCWQPRNLDAAKYDKVLISRMKVSLKPGQQEGIDRG